MVKWAEPYKPLRQRTVRSETTKDKCGTLPVVFYQKDIPQTELYVHPYQEVVHDQDEELDMVDRPGPEEPRVPLLQAVSDIESEYDSASDFEESHAEVEVEPLSFLRVTRSGRSVRSVMRLDL